MADKFRDACEAAVSFMLGKDRTVQGFLTDRNRDRQVASIRACVPVLERMERILKDATIRFKKPKITKADAGGSIQVDSLYVTPCAQLVSGAELLNINHRHDLDYVGNNGMWFIPRVFYGNGINLGLTFHHVQVEEILAKAVLSDVQGRLDELLAKLAIHWLKTESCAPQIVSKYRARYGVKDCAEFRKKMVKALRKCPGLVDESPELVLRVMQLDHSELLALADFAKGSLADIPIVNVEDVKMVLDELRVSGVMES